jgi:hypothetical protein
VAHLKAEQELPEEDRQHNLYWTGYDTQLSDPRTLRVAQEKHKMFVEGVLDLMPDVFPDEWHSVTTSHTRLTQFLNKVLDGLE